MAIAVRSELIEPKNRTFYVAILAGGCADMYRWTRRKLRREGIDLIIHWDPDDARVTGIPGHVDFVLFFKEFAGKLEPRVVSAARRFDVPIIRTIRKWATMQEDLTRWNLLGMCSALPDDAEDVTVPEEEPADTEEQEAREIAVAEARAKAAQAKDDEEKKRRDEERAAADERARRHEEQRRAMGLPPPARSYLEELREREAREADHQRAIDEACRLALEENPVAPGAVPVRAPAVAVAAPTPMSTPDPEEKPMQKISPPPPMPIKNGAVHHPVPDAAHAVAPAPPEEFGPALVGMVASHLRGLTDAALLAAIPPAALATFVRGLGDAALVDAGKDYARRMMTQAFGGATPGPSLVATAPPRPSSGREAPERERVYQGLIATTTRLGGAATLGDIARDLREKVTYPISAQLRELRKEGLAFQTGAARSSFWALSQVAADRAYKRAQK